jgi:integrase
MLQDELASGASAIWTRRTRDVLRNALNHAVKWELVSRNAAAVVTPPKVEVHEPTILTPEQLHLFLTAIRGERLEGLYRVALMLGLREGEVLGLRWQDIDAEHSKLKVTHALQRVDGAWQLVRPKTAKSQRTLPLPPSLVATLKQHKIQQLQERLVAGNRWAEHDLVFPSSVGTPISLRNLYRSFQRLLERAGLPRMRFHDLRHNCATLLATLKIEPKTAMEILDHSNLHTTLMIYTHVLDDSKHDALAAVERLFDAGTDA